MIPQEKIGCKALQTLMRPQNLLPALSKLNVGPDEALRLLTPGLNAVMIASHDTVTSLVRLGARITTSPLEFTGCHIPHGTEWDLGDGVAGIQAAAMAFTDHRLGGTLELRPGVIARGGRRDASA